LSSRRPLRKDHLGAAKERDLAAVRPEHGRRPDLRRPPQVLGHAFGAQRAFLRRAEEIRLQLDGGEILGALREMRDRRIAGAGVGEQDHARRVQIAVRRPHPRFDVDLGDEPALRELDHAQAVPARQGAALALPEMLGRDLGSQHR
jgi:hypothetical protein